MVSLDLGRWIAITRPRTRRYPDLISVVHLGSGGPGRLGARWAALTAGAEAPAAARRRSNAQTRSRPWLRLGFGPGERVRHE